MYECPEYTTRRMNQHHRHTSERSPEGSENMGKVDLRPKPTWHLTARNHHHLVYPPNPSHPTIHPIHHNAQLSSLPILSFHPNSPKLPPCACSKTTTTTNITHQQYTQLGSRFVGGFMEWGEAPSILRVDARVELDQQCSNVHMLWRGTTTEERHRQWHRHNTAMQWQSMVFWLMLDTSYTYILYLSDISISKGRQTEKQSHTNKFSPMSNYNCMQLPWLQHSWGESDQLQWLGILPDYYTTRYICIPLRLNNASFNTLPNQFTLSNLHNTLPLSQALPELCHDAYCHNTAQSWCQLRLTHTGTFSRPFCPHWSTVIYVTILSNCDDAHNATLSRNL